MAQTPEAFSLFARIPGILLIGCNAQEGDNHLGVEGRFRHCLRQLYSSKKIGNSRHCLCGFRAIRRYIDSHLIST